jgi:hypothetical protein
VSAPPRVLLGPQRLAPIVDQVVSDLGLLGPVALITAGWQEREPEDDELKAALGVPSVNLGLYGRWEDVQARDPAFFDAHRKRQDRLRRLQELYRERLGHLVDAVDEMMAAPGEPDLVDPERAQALEAVRALDAHHLSRAEAEHRQFAEAIEPWERPVIAGHRREMQIILDGCDSVAMAGGHVGVLLNRLKMFGIEPLVRDKAVFAWSAGAMAITDRVVLFHDRPPQGAGHAEVLDRGLGLFPGVVALPHAKRRLDLTEPERVAMWARRFMPSVCVPLDDRCRLDLRGGRLIPSGGVCRLDGAGRVRPIAGTAA